VQRSVGVLGAGQLGRMLALAGYPLEVSFRFLDPKSGSPAGQVAEQLVAGWDDGAALERLAREAEVVTFEFESIPEPAARRVSELTPVRPPPEALAIAQDRLVEKNFFSELGIPTARYVNVTSLAELESAAREIGLPAVLKTRRLGYDGKGQYLIRQESELSPAWQAVGGAPSILEAWVPFERELSQLAVRGIDGTTAFYPLVENHHDKGVLRLTIAPAARAGEELERAARDAVRKIFERLDYVGAFALELFEVDGKLFANEFAPRVHNSGHFTIEGAVTSQFENHLRAILGLPLGSTALRGYSAMVNMIGNVPEPAELLALPDAHVHLYGKGPAPGRKLGHVTVCAPDAATRDQRARAACQVVGWLPQKPPF